MKQNKNDLKNAKLLAAIINNKPNQKLLSLLYKRERTVSQLIKETGWPQSVVSARLGNLFKIGLLDRRKKGRFAYYMTTSYWPTRIAEWCALASKIFDNMK